MEDLLGLDPTAELQPLLKLNKTEYLSSYRDQIEQIRVLPQIRNFEKID